MGGYVLKNWKPREVISFLKSQGFEEIKKAKRSRGDHVCLLRLKSGAYTEVDFGRKSFSAREMLSFVKQSGIGKVRWKK